MAKAHSIRAVFTRPYRTERRLRIHVWAPAFTGFGGGIASFSRALAVGLRDVGHDLRLFGKTDGSSAFDGMPLVGTRRYSIFSQSQAFALRALASIGRRRPDHLISTHVNFGPAAHIAKRTFGTPYTLIAHGIDIHPRLPDATLASLRAADGIVAVSEWTRLRVLDLGGIESGAVRVLPNTFDEDRFCLAPLRRDLRARYNIGDEERVIVTVARLAEQERYKGYDRVMRALKAVSDAVGPVRFILVGEGKDSARVGALASVLGIRSMVTLTGFVSDEELADHYRLADAFVMPSTGEGFGIVFLEAMACGTPVVAGNRDGSVDALGNGTLGCLVDPNDIDAISRGITNVLERNGPELWFDPQALRQATVTCFGQQAFRRNLKKAFQFLP